jgi:hypothetical protein
MTINWSIPYLPGVSNCVAYLSTLPTLKGTVNGPSDYLVGTVLHPYTALITDVQLTDRIYHGWPYVDAQVVMDIRKDSWWTPILNNGFREVKASGIVADIFTTNERGNDATCLTPSGVRLPSEEWGNPWYALFLLHKAEDFNKLSLPVTRFASPTFDFLTSST